MVKRLRLLGLRQFRNCFLGGGGLRWSSFCDFWSRGGFHGWDFCSNFCSNFCNWSCGLFHSSDGGCFHDWSGRGLLGHGCKNAGQTGARFVERTHQLGSWAEQKTEELGLKNFLRRKVS